MTLDDTPSPAPANDEEDVDIVGSSSDDVDIIDLDHYQNAGGKAVCMCGLAHTYVCILHCACVVCLTCTASRVKSNVAWVHSSHHR